MHVSTHSVASGCSQTLRKDGDDGWMAMTILEEDRNGVFELIYPFQWTGRLVERLSKGHCARILLKDQAYPRTA